MNRLSFKIRVWLVKCLSGKYSFDKLTEQRERHLMTTAIDKLYEHLKQYVDDTMQASINKMPQEMLAQVIAANVHLSELQKSQIASIISTPSQSDNSRYYFG